MGWVATPPPGVAGGVAAADVCGRAKGVEVAASQQGQDALCLYGKVAILEEIVCIIAKSASTLGPVILLTQ